MEISLCHYLEVLARLAGGGGGVAEGGGDQAEQDEELHSAVISYN